MNSEAAERVRAYVVAYLEADFDADVSKLLSLKPLHARTTTIWVVSLGYKPTYIVREITSREWVNREPSVRSQEARALTMLAASVIPVPRLLAHDQSASIQGQALTLMTYMPGTVHENLTQVSSAKLSAAAKMLARIHSVQIGIPHDTWPSFKPHYYNQTERVLVPDWTKNPSTWRDAINVYRSECNTHNATDDLVLLHRDYHFGNLLWEGDSVSAVLDWISSCIGPRAADLAHCRWNLCRFYGKDACDFFTDEYGLHVPNLARMDVVACVGGLPDLRSLTAEQALRIESFMTRAIAQC